MKNTAFSRFLSLALALLMLHAAAPYAAAATTLDGNLIQGEGLYIMDFETGLELYSQNPDTAYVPASITKLMTVYLTYEAITEGRITMDTTVPISAKVRQMSLDSSYNNAPLSYNETYTVAEMLDIVLIYSASGCAVALAELLAGSEEAFVEQMNAKAKELGISATYHGASGIENNYVTPRGMAILSRAILTEYPQVLAITSKTSTNFHGTVYPCTNNLLTSQYYEGVDGLKSGTTPAAGYCFIGTAQQDGVRLITVVLKSTTATQRYSDTKVLLDYGFSVRDAMVRESLRLYPYTDVYLNDWFAEDVRDAAALGLMTGTREDTFAPNAAMTRAAAATALHRAAGLPSVSYTPLFPDVQKGAWYTDAVLWLSATHQPEGSIRYPFGVNNVISREDFATFLQTAAQNLGRDVSKQADLTAFTDANQVGQWAEEALSWAVSEGLLGGTSASTLSPQDNLTRAQCATLLLRFSAWLDAGPEAETNQESKPDQDMAA